MHQVALAVHVADCQVVGVDVHAHGAELEVRLGPGVGPLGRGEHPPAGLVPHEPVADGLSPLERGVKLPLTVLEPDVVEHQVLRGSVAQRVGQPQAQAERAVVGDGGGAALVAAALVLRAEQKELARTRPAPIVLPLRVVGVAVASEVELGAEQLAAAEAQGDMPGAQRLGLGFQARQTTLLASRTRRWRASSDVF